MRGLITINYKEIDKLVLERVMNCEYKKDLNGWVEKSTNATSLVFPSNFSPSTNLSNAFVVLDKLKKNKLFVDICVAKKKVSVTLRSTEDHHFVAGWCSNKVAPTICFAALVYKQVDIPSY